jgi:hypothetical protein
MTLDTFYYGSSLSKSELNSRNIPGYIATETPFTQGFNLRSAELSIFAPVDPYFNFYATIPFTDSGGSLEEAYFVTTSLPAGFQLKGGKFRSGFGRINAFHPHAWDFVDIPLAYKAFIGDEGLIEKGAQLTYLPNFPFYTVLGMEVLQGDNPILYGSDAQSGFHAYTGFVKTSLDLGTTHTLLLGGSATGGKTLTDSAAPNTQFTGNSILYGVELTYKWKPSKKESFILQSEYLYRSQRGDLSAYTVPVTDSLKRLQDGIYVQGIYQWQRWRFGARYDHLGLFQDTVILGGEKINYDQNLYRMTGSLEFNPTEFSRIRLQYNYDRSDPNQKVNQELFLQLILAVGAHGAHPF